MLWTARLPVPLRCYYTSSIMRAADKQLLSKLRKATGFSFLNCRQALEKFDNDMKQAESWLRERAQKEGWAKASKLQSRPMSQGLIGIATQDKSAVMVEVNCETDFVSRNNKFQSLVSTVAMGCLHHGISSSSNKILWDRASVGSLIVDNKTISDLTALEVGNVGENIAVRRAVFLRAANDRQQLGSYVHATGAPTGSVRGSCLFGKYGSLVLCESTCLPTQSLDGAITLEELSRQLCQHVVGMNPRSIGSPDDAAAATGDEETRLLYQEYMHDTTLTVRDILDQNGVKVLDFVRLQCGEILPEDDSG